MPANAGSAHTNAKERKARKGKKRKGIEAHKVKHPTPSQAMMRSQGIKSRTEDRREQKKETGRRPPTQLPGPLGHLLRHMVGIFWNPLHPQYIYIFVYYYYCTVTSSCHCGAVHIMPRNELQ